MPVLPRVREPDRLAVLHDVGEDHHLGNPRLLESVGDVDLQLPEARAEIGELPARELLPRKAHHAESPQRAQHGVELLVRQRLREIEPGYRRAESLSAAYYFHPHPQSILSPASLMIFA